MAENGGMVIPVVSGTAVRRMNDKDFENLRKAYQYICDAYEKGETLHPLRDENGKTVVSFAEILTSDDFIRETKNSEEELPPGERADKLLKNMREIEIEKYFSGRNPAQIIRDAEKKLDLRTVFISNSENTDKQISSIESLVIQAYYDDRVEKCRIGNLSKDSSDFILDYCAIKLAHDIPYPAKERAVPAEEKTAERYEALGKTAPEIQGRTTDTEKGISVALYRFAEVYNILVECPNPRRREILEIFRMSIPISIKQKDSCGGRVLADLKSMVTAAAKAGLINIKGKEKPAYNYMKKTIPENSFPER